MPGKKLYEFTHIHQPNLFTDQDLAAGLGKNLDKLEVILLSARKDAKSISDSKDFTKDGKINQLKDLSAKADRETKDWRASMHYAEMIRQVEAEMKPIQKRTDDQVGEMRKREIRDYLQRLDPLMQEAAYREAAAGGNDLLLSAIEESPIPFVFATQAQIDKIQFQRLETQYPKQAARLHDLQTASQQVDSALNAVRASLREHSLEIRGVDPVQELATA